MSEGRDIREAAGLDAAVEADFELMARSARGDRHAFATIVERYGPMALRVAARMVSDRHAAEDIAQEAMVRAWTRASDFDPARARFSTWLYRIVVNLCIDSNRRLRPGPLPSDFDPADPAANTARDMEAHEQLAALATAIEELPPRQRAALSLVYEEGLAGAEAARVLGVSVKALERMLARARERLRKTLKDPLELGSAI
jgi:RNA polymerase sigma-70 factor (ECF subfamily)